MNFKKDGCQLKQDFDFSTRYSKCSTGYVSIYTIDLAHLLVVVTATGQVYSHSMGHLKNSTDRIHYIQNEHHFIDSFNHIIKGKTRLRKMCNLNSH